MARTRLLKPDFFLNDDLGKLEFAARILFAGLWCLADREGRLKDRPMKIKAQILPYDDIDIERLLNILSEKGFIVRYSVVQNQYIKILAWSKHQRPHYKEDPSEIPEYNQAVHQSRVNHDSIMTHDQVMIEPSLPSLTLPSYFDPLTLNPLQKHEACFNQFYDQYPKKVGKGQAEKAWKAIKPDQALTETMITAVRKQIAWRKAATDRGEFVPEWKHPATWLRSRCWEDEVPNERTDDSEAAWKRAVDAVRRDQRIEDPRLREVAVLVLPGGATMLGKASAYEIEKYRKEFIRQWNQAESK